MNIFIFKCNNATEQYCLQKNLFGTKEPWTNEVEADSFCLLYNFQSEIVYGIWRASGVKGLIDENAFEGRFPHQVKLNIDYQLNEIRKTSKEKIQKLTGRMFSAKSPIKVELAEKDLYNLFDVEDGITFNEISLIDVLEQDFRQKYPREFHCDDGHDVRSQGETMIDNWLFKNNICHGYEVLMDVEERIFCDFTVYDKNKRPVYLEYWGKEGNSDYEKRKEEKIKIYLKYNFDLIEIFPDDLKNLDHIMRVKLRNKSIIK